MRILVNHLTRMHGAHICVAGVDLDTRRHVRPTLAHEPLPFYLLARYGGPFEMAAIVDVGSPRAAPVAPHIEDHVFVPAPREVPIGPPPHTSSGALLEELQRPHLQDIFGEALHEVGHGRGQPSRGKGRRRWGCFAPPRRPICISREVPMENRGSA